MCTRSKSYLNNSNVIIPKRSNRRRVPNIVKPEIRTIEEVIPMADRTMKELLQAPTEGYGEAIVISKILDENFKIKTNLLQLVQTNKFHGFERNNPHTHISNFKRMTSTLKYRDVPNDAIKLMLFPYSLEGAARNWYEKEPPNSILTWDDLVNQFFPPSKTTHLKNEISRFTQRFEETFREDWERFKEMLRACPHHGFSELTQIDTFYNGLNKQDQDSLNADRWKSFEVNTNFKESSSKTDDRIDKLTEQISNLVEIVNKQVITHATAKAVEKTCVICGGAHAYYDCIATDSNQSSDCAATGTLPSNTVPNPKGEMKAVTTRSGLAYEGPSIPTNSPLEKVVEREAEETTDKEQSNCQGSTAHIQAPVVPIPILKSDVSKTQPKPNIPYPSRLNDQKLCEKATNQMAKFFQIFHDLHFDISFADALLLMPKFASTINSLLTNKDKLFELAKVPLNENCSAMLLKKLPEKLGVPSKFLIPCDFPGIDVCQGLADLGASINLMPLSIWKKLSLPELTPTRINLELTDRSITRPKGVAEDVFVKVGKFHFPTDFVQSQSNHEIFFYDPEGDILYLEMLLNDDPSQLPPMDLKQAEETKAKSLIEEPPVSELKELPSHLEYAFLEETDKLPDKCHFMCKEGIVLGHKILKSGIEVDRAKVDVIAKLPHPTTVKGVRSFLGHASFYRCFIQDFSIIARPMTHLLEKETPFVFSKDCVDAFETLKKKLTEAPILVVPDWNLPFELMCDASDFAIGAVLGQHHSTLKYLLSNQDAKPRLLWWVLLLQEFDITIRDKKGLENLVADHLLRLENPHKDVLETKDINENFPLETLESLSSGSTPWFADIENFHAGNFIKKGLTFQQKKKLFKDVKHYFWDDPYLF
uniref:Reverse transcriptase domain-containing protein n=1 Tax=Tanacetum cinerariifolium TaxID=118510 RepID=A0A6L2NGP0_TANCI|nr:reverse transcriptase domain-containing protein [Tanacetum cinerariifolium]